MSPTPRLDEIKLTDIEFNVVKEATDKHVIKRYIQLLEEDGGYFRELLQACKDRLLEVAPKEYYLLYPRKATDQEIDEAKQDLLNWEETVTETDKALLKSKKDLIFDDAGAKVRAPVRGQEPVVARPSLAQKEPEPARPPPDKPRGKNDVYARDKTKMKDYYSAWDQVDVDAIEAEMEREEKEQEESRQRHFEELREQQEAAHASSAVDVSEGLAGGVHQAHRRHLADSEKEKGNEAFYSKDYEEAEAYYSRSLQFCADDPSAWANRALVRLKLERPEAALEDCNHSLALNPRYMKALHRKGKALYELQRYEGAVKAFQDALIQAPGNTQINGDLMVARRKLRTAEPEPTASSHKERPRRVDDPPSAVIEELPDDEDTGAGARPEPAPGYTRVVIEEDSDSEEEAPAPAAAGSTSRPGGFRKVVIEDVSSDEEEAGGKGPSKPFEAGPAAVPPAASAQASAPAATAGATGAVFRKVQIVEESDGEDDGEAEPKEPKASPASSSVPGRAAEAKGSQGASANTAALAPAEASPSSGSTSAAASGFRKVQIVEEASDSEEGEAEPARGATGGTTFSPPPRAAAAAVPAAPPAPAVAAPAQAQPLCFDDMD